MPEPTTDPDVYTYRTNLWLWLAGAAIVLGVVSFFGQEVAAAIWLPMAIAVGFAVGGTLGPRLGVGKMEVRLTASGLSVGRGVSQRHHPWDKMTAVRDGRNGLVLESRNGQRVWLPRSTTRFEELVARVRELAGHEPLDRETAPQVPPEQIEAWLGVEPGGSLTTRSPRWGWLGAAAVAPLFAWFAAFPHLPAVRSWFVAGAALLLFLTGWRGITRLTPRVTASGQGLTVQVGRRKHHYDWSELLGIQRIWQSADPGAPTVPRADVTGRWLLLTTAGTVPLHARNEHARRIAETVQRVVQAVDEGAALPLGADVSDAAISLTRMTGDPEVERGISVARQEDDDD